MMIVIIMVFVVCYLFNCIFDVIFIFKWGYVVFFSFVILVIFLLIVRIFFINNVINLFIYFLGDLKFRNIIK